MDFQTLHFDVISKGLCARCGICAGACPVQAIHFDDEQFPVLVRKCAACGLCSRVCPGKEVDFPFFSKSLFGVVYDPSAIQGYVEKNFVGYAASPDIRLAGASGGLVTGLLSYLLEKGKIDGAIVVEMDSKDPMRSQGIVASTSERLLRSAKSKYCITPAMGALGHIRRLKGRFAVVGLPCQVHGLRKLFLAEPKLSTKIPYVLGLYCHQSMEPAGHRELIELQGIDPSEVADVEFRGGTWPGRLQVVLKSGRGLPLHDLDMRNMMNLLFRLYECQRCMVCIDALCEFADLSFGDFWAEDYEGFLGSLTESTLVSQRTPVGRQLLHDALKDGAAVLHELPWKKTSRRILNFAKEKKERAFSRILRLRRAGKVNPDYGCRIPAVSLRGKRQEALRRVWELLAHGSMRRSILKLALSRYGLVMEKLNNNRKQIFYDFHDP